MIKRVLDFLSGKEAPAPGKGADDFQLAVAALLVEAARMDDTFDANERAVITRLLTQKFQLPADEVAALIGAAEEKVRASTQLFPFTQQVAQRMSPETRVEIIEMLWQVVYADGALDPYEDMLLRRIAGLIHVPDRERGLARQRALAKLAARGGKAAP